MAPLPLVLRGVRLQRGGRVLVEDANIEVRAGELLVLRGHSGSGKTTALRALAGLDGFEGGAIDIGEARLEAGRRPDREMLRKLRRSVGLVFQFHCLFEHMSALQNICLALVHVHRVSPQEAERLARGWLAQLGVESRVHALPRELSGGEAQRVAIARALAVDPPVLLMDEPMASLDPPRRAELGAILQRLTDAGRTLVVTSHDEAFAQQFATRILTIEDGKLVERRG